MAKYILMIVYQFTISPKMYFQKRKKRLDLENYIENTDLFKYNMGNKDFNIRNDDYNFNYQD